MSDEEYNATLFMAVVEYLNEMDNPAIDPTMRKIRRDRLRDLVNVPEPKKI